MIHLLEIQTTLTVTKTSAFNSNVDALALPSAINVFMADVQNWDTTPTLKFWLLVMEHAFWL